MTGIKSLNRAQLGRLTTLTYNRKLMKQILIIIALLLTACAGSEKTSGIGSSSTLPKHYHTLSSDMKGLLGVNALYVAQPSFSKSLAVDSAGRNRFEELLMQTAKGSLDVEIVNENGVKLKGIVPADNQVTLDSALKLARGLKADSVLMTRISTYNEREGGRAGASQGAALGFSAELYRVSDGKNVWSGQYYRQDEALTDNLFNIKDKLGRSGSTAWQSADDLIQDGLNNAISDLQDRRLAAFQGHG